MWQITEVAAEAVNIPMRSPFVTAKRTSAIAENVRVAVSLPGGVTGYGEGSPAAYVTGETPASVLAGARAVAPKLVGRDVRRTACWAPLLADLGPTCRSALEMALLDAQTRVLGIPLYYWFGGAQTAVTSDLTLSIGPAAEVAERAQAAVARGFRVLKIKVGGPSVEEDLERVIAISQAAPKVKLRLDANQAFTPEGALKFLADCERHGVLVELMEQPVPAEDLDALAAVTARSTVPVIADEAVVDARAALQVATRHAAHGVNIKIAKAGMLGAMSIVRIAQAAGLQLMLGCMMESPLGIGAALHLACGVGAFDYLDLDSHLLIGVEAGGNPFTQVGDRLSVSENEPGIGFSVS